MELAQTSEELLEINPHAHEQWDKQRRRIVEVCRSSDSQEVDVENIIPDIHRLAGSNGRRVLVVPAFPLNLLVSGLYKLHQQTGRMLIRCSLNAGDFDKIVDPRPEELFGSEWNVNHVVADASIEKVLWDDNKSRFGDLGEVKRRPGTFQEFLWYIALGGQVPNEYAYTCSQVWWGTMRDPYLRAVVEDPNAKSEATLQSLRRPKILQIDFGLPEECNKKESWVNIFAVSDEDG